MRARRGDHRRIVRGDRRVGAVREQQPRDLDKRRVHLRFVLIGDRSRFFVRPLDQADARAELVHPPGVLQAAPQRRLQHDTGVAVSLLPHGLEDVERHLGKR